MGDSVKATDRKVYEKPQLRIIELAAEEVLAAGCKTASGSVSAFGAITCFQRPCSASGS
jgi:hypothetical protein